MTLLEQLKQDLQEAIEELPPGESPDNDIVIKSLKAQIESMEHGPESAAEMFHIGPIPEDPMSPNRGTPGDILKDEGNRYTEQMAMEGADKPIQVRH